MTNDERAARALAKILGSGSATDAERAAVREEIDAAVLDARKACADEAMVLAVDPSWRREPASLVLREVAARISAHRSITHS